MARWEAYDDDLAGLEAYCEEALAQRLHEAKQAGRPKLSAKERKREQLYALYDEREAAVAYKTIVAACRRGSLRSLTLEPHWVLQTRNLVSKSKQITLVQLDS